jgi:hypothetical protein
MVCWLLTFLEVHRSHHEEHQTELLSPRDSGAQTLCCATFDWQACEVHKFQTCPGNASNTGQTRANSTEGDLGVTDPLMYSFTVILTYHHGGQDAEALRQTL